MNASGPVLVTGFEAFGDSEINPTAKIIDNLHGDEVLGRGIVGLELPVSLEQAPRLLHAAVETHLPELVISLGLANGRSSLAIERVAVNVLDFPLADNDGVQPIDQPVVPGGPDAYFATAPIKSIFLSWVNQGLPGYVSNSAGTYLCNAVFYHSLHLAAGRGHRCALVHVPYLPEQAAAVVRANTQSGVITHLPNGAIPSMGLDAMMSAVRSAIEVSLSTRADVVLAAGAVS